MRIIKQLVTVVSITFVLPVAIVAISGFALAPFQAAAEPLHGHVVLEADDIPWSAAAGPSSMPIGDKSGQDQESQADFVIAPAVEETGAIVDFGVSGDFETLSLSNEVAAYVESETSPDVGSSCYTSDQLRNRGVIFDGGYRYTWYSQRVLPGTGLRIDGRHVTDEGYVADSQGRIVVASSDLPYGTELAIPFGSGMGIVLDAGCAPGTIDIYTDF